MCGALPGEIRKPQVKQANCAHFVLNSTSLQLIPALYLESRVSMMESFSKRA